MKNAALVAHISTPLLGVSTGIRSFTPLAVAAWFAHQERLPLKGTWASWIGHPVSVGLLTAGAIGEYVGDKLPNTPNRTSPMGLFGRLSTGALVGAIVATAFRRPILRGVALGVLGSAAGTYGGFYLRRELTHTAGLPDLPVALSGDVAAIAMAVRSLNRLTS